MLNSPDARRAARAVILRFVSIFLLTALVTPAFLLSDIGNAKAQAKPINVSLPVPSAPPEPFIVGRAPHGRSLTVREGSNGGVQATLAASVTTAIYGLISTPKLPEGFEMAKVPTLGERIGSTFASLLAFAAPKTTNSVVAAPPSPSGSVDFDFDGDDKADLARWHSSNTEFKVKNSNGGTYSTHTIGSTSAKPAPADYDGDGKTDAATFDAGTWKIIMSAGNGSITTITGFGQSGDVPVSGNYTGSSAADAAVYRPSTGTWYVREAVNGTVTSGAFGTSGDIAVPGNYDGGTLMDFAVYRPSTGDWHILGSQTGYYALHWGVASDIPAAADYDGDGKTDCAVYRSSAGTWYVHNSSQNPAYTVQVWGNYGDQPVPADYS